MTSSPPPCPPLLARTPAVTLSRRRTAVTASRLPATLTAPARASPVTAPAASTARPPVRRSPSSLSTSPPKTITLDDVMSSARDLSNLTLAHEIIVNRDFHVEQPHLSQNSLEKQVKDIVHKAFWDSLESELNDDPPEYEHAIKLLEEIREILLSFLSPGANRLRTQILEVLDMDLIRQQADKEAVDIQGLASYIVTIMSKLCAPVRDDEVKKLRESPDYVVSMFKEIFRVLDLMKMDMVNFTIQSLRPDLQRQSVEYERAKFQSVVEKTPSALDHTTEWIKSSLEEVLFSMPTVEQPNGHGKAGKALPSPFLVFNSGFIRLLTWDYHKSPLPETLMTDEVRLRELQRRLQLLKAVASVLLIVYSAIGGPISGLPALAERLKRMTSVLLEGIHSPDFNLSEALGNVSGQICCELNKSLTERNYPALPPELQVTLKGQITSITQENNPIRSLLEGRVQQYFRVLLATPNSHVNLPPMPGGLALIQPELTSLAVTFVSLVNFNKQVYSPFYMMILKTLLFSNEAPPPAATAPQDPSIQNPVNSK
ncbi:T-complex protein 11-like protein 2 isoform X3 [Salmo salar]|nr:T-complex protein 11-like protein 2 isoform X3 [Salmo salar]XP_045555961.1 T-complex protein 11-like protein 2 isoform X3 [Salmo salar]XP_045555962.1 T-complex protein 11-like protein 2 isoform X3 [Salmo salar]|eukprot:XP_014009112.1 PREDICTED: T-complex protein 11-like protein 2 isoform X1 [Salmo salar]